MKRNLVNSKGLVLLIHCKIVQSNINLKLSSTKMISRNESLPNIEQNNNKELRSYVESLGSLRNGP